MDMDFIRLKRARRVAVPARLDYARLVAGIAAMQAATRTAAVEARLAVTPIPCESPVDALVTLFATRPGWVSAVATLGGSFHPGVARALGAGVCKD